MMPSFADRFIELDGLRIHYWDEGSGPPLLLVHGVGVTVESWANNVQALAENHRVIAFDLPGFGRSSRSARKDLYSLEYAGHFIKQLVSALGISKLSVVGNSLGGMLVIQFALTYPEMIDKLILIDSAGLGREINWSAPLVAIRPIGEILIHPTRPFIKFYARALLYRSDLITDEFVDRMFELSKIPGTKEAMLRIIRTGVNFKGQFAAFKDSQLRNLTMPICIIWGKYDRALPIKHAVESLKIIPDCRAVIIDRAGHAPHMERPEIFNKLAMEFLDNGGLEIEKTQANKGPFYM